MSKVIVTSEKESGNILCGVKAGKDGKNYGYVRVQSTVQVESNGFLVNKTRSALIPMSQETFNSSPLFAGQELPGRILILESLENKPGYQPKLAGEGGTPCLKGGQQIYRTTKWTTAADATDMLVAHDNVIVGSSVTASKVDAINK